MYYKFEMELDTLTADETRSIKIRTVCYGAVRISSRNVVPSFLESDVKAASGLAIIRKSGIPAALRYRVFFFIKF